MPDSRTHPVPPPGDGPPSSVQLTMRLSSPSAPAPARPRAGPAPPPAFETPGGRYQLLGELARGGMGVVYRGYDRELKRETAVKVLLARYLDQPDIVRRFHEEASITGQLQHPGVVSVYDAGRLAEGLPYFVMKLVDGRTFAHFLDRRPAPDHDRPRLLKIFEQVCQTIAYAHSRGVIHRDLKPGNVMVGEFGEVQVMDWGLAEVLATRAPHGPDRTAAAEPEPGGASRERERPEPESSMNSRRLRRSSTTLPSWPAEVVGTPAYMAPEQACGAAELDERCDVFGLGAILCEVLTGHPPFCGSRASDTFRQAVRGDLAAAHQRLAAVADEPELVALARECLGVTPAERPCDAGAVAGRVTAYLAGVEARMRHAEQERAAAVLRAAEERKRRRLVGALAAAVVAVLLTAAGAAVAVVVQESRREKVRHALAQSEVERAAAAVGRVHTAVEEAAALRDQARRAGADALPSWTHALDAARRAERLLTAEVTDAELRARVHDLVAELTAQEREAREAARDRAMFARLEQIRLDQAEVKNGRFDMDRSHPEYRRAFAEYGIDVLALAPDEAGRQVRGRRIAAELAAGLTAWFEVRRGTPDPVAQGEAGRLLAAAQAADPDPWRTAFRAALAGDDAPALRGLADRPDVVGQPPAALAALGGALEALGDRPAAVQVYRAAAARHPGDFWLNHNLGMALYAQRADDDEALRFVAAAVALRPRSPGARNNLALLLLNRGAYPAAAAEYQAAVALKPDYAEAQHGLGTALNRVGRRREAEAALARAMALRPEFAEALGELAVLHHDAGRRDDAVAEWRAALRLKPDLRGVHYNIGNVLAESGRRAEAEAEYRAELRLNPGYAEAHCNLGHVLREQGRFAEAVAALARGHDLGRAQPRWPYPSAQWLAHASQLLAIDQRLTAVAGGDPAGVDELVRLAQFAAADRREPATALELYRRAFRQQPALAAGPCNPLRSQAVELAVRVGSDPAALTPARRAYWRQTALDWLRADLAVLRTAPAGAARGELDRRLADAALRPVRDLDRLAVLPVAERDAWAEFWAAADGLRRKLATTR